MGLIKGSQFQAIADRLAKQAINLEEAILENRSGTSYYINVHGPLPYEGDFQVENDLISSANLTDTNMVLSQASSSFFTNIINSLNNHVIARGSDASITSLNDYLNQSGINVHELYAEVYEDIVGTALNAVNVFRDDEIEMGCVTITSSGVGTFTDKSSLGTGSGSFVRETFDGTVTANSAEQNVQWCTPSGIGATDIELNVIGINETGNTVNMQTTISAATTNSGTCAQLGPDQFKLLDVTSIQFAGGSSGDIVMIRSIVERNVGL